MCVRVRICRRLFKMKGRINDIKNMEVQIKRKKKNNNIINIVKLTYFLGETIDKQKNRMLYNKI